MKIARADTLDDAGAATVASRPRPGRRCPVDVMGGIDHFALADRPLDGFALLEFHIIPKGVPGPETLPRVAHLPLNL